MFHWLMLVILLPVAAGAQGPGGRGPAAGASWWEMPWWNSPLVQSMDLSESQRGDIRNIVRDSRAHLIDLRAAIEKADAELNAAFSGNPLDQRQGTEAIDHLANARADLTRALSHMTLKLRNTLTTEQWQELRRRSESRRGRGRARGQRPLPTPPQSGNLKQ